MLRNCFAAAKDLPKCCVGAEKEQYGLDHERAGEIVLVSTPNSWQAYYWWLDDARAPGFARTVDIHRKPGYDPVELFFDPATQEHSAQRDAWCAARTAPRPASRPAWRDISSQPGVLVGNALADTDVCDLVLRQYGI